MTDPTLQSIVRIPDGVVFQQVEGEAVILSTETGKYYGLDSVGTRIWDLIAQHGQVETVYRALLAEYDVTEERLLQDLFRFLGELASQGLVEVDGG